MINIKVKHIIILVFILLLIFIYFYKDKIRNYLTVEGFTTLEDTEFNFNTVILELFYQSNCPITQQFMEGCCLEFPNNGNDLSMQIPSGTNFLKLYDNSVTDKEYLVNNTISNVEPRTDIESQTRNITIYRTGKYIKNSVCQSLDGYQEGFCTMKNIPKYHLLAKCIVHLNNN